MDEKDLAKELGKRFLQRRETKARQFNDGHYEPVKEPWKLSDLEDHLAGRATWGHYLVDDENNCRVAAFDIDLRADGQWRPDFDSEYVDIKPREIWADQVGKSIEMVIDLRLQLRCMAEGLALRARRSMLDVAVAYSGNKGMHVYIFFPAPTPAIAARVILEDILDSFGCFERYRGEHLWRHIDGYRALEIEVFPKQDTVREGGLGNLMRLPLGVHRKSNLPSYFVDLTAGYGELRADDPARALVAGSLR